MEVEKGTSGDTALSLPAASFVQAEARCSPAERRKEDLRDQAPSAPACTVPSWAPLRRTITVLPGSATPEKVGVRVKSRVPCFGA